MAKSWPSWPTPALVSHGSSMSSRQCCRPNVSCWKLTQCRTARPRRGCQYLSCCAVIFDLQDADAPTSRREKVRAALGALDPALADVPPYLWNLLAIPEDPNPLAQMDPKVKRRRTLDSITRIILRESLEHALVVIFEDLHWIDSETQALLDALADSIANSRVLLLVNYRPEYRHEWTNKSYYSQLRLAPLGRESAGEMLSALLGDGVELEPLKRLIIERTEGNPFFIEEMVQALFEDGALVRNGAVKVA